MSSRMLVGAALVAAIVLVPAFASARTGDNIREGVRNPSGGTDAQRETQIIARTAKDTYGTRQSNLGAGGGAIYGCRSTLDSSVAAAIGDPKRSTPCLRVNNLSSGKAFDFQSNTGKIIGVIQAGNSLLAARADTAPFVTNANAVAVGLNADRVDSLNANEIVTQAANAAVAAIGPGGGGGGGGGGGVCPANTTLAGGGCIENSPRPALAYAAAAAACGEAGRRLVPPDVLLHARTLGPINLGGGEMSGDTTAATLALAQGYTTVADGGAMGVETLGTATAFRCITR